MKPNDSTLGAGAAPPGASGARERERERRERERGVVVKDFKALTTTKARATHTFDIWFY